MTEHAREGAASGIVTVNVCPEGGTGHLYDLDNGKCLHPHDE